MTLSLIRPDTLSAQRSTARQARHDELDALGDVLTPPARTTSIGDVVTRHRHGVEGIVTDVSMRQWVGGAVLEVTLHDDGHELVLVFFGRRSIAGVEVGSHLCANGVVGRNRGRAVMLNPRYWLGH